MRPSTMPQPPKMKILAPYQLLIKMQTRMPTLVRGELTKPGSLQHMETTKWGHRCKNLAGCAREIDDLYYNA